MMLLFTQ